MIHGLSSLLLRTIWRIIHITSRLKFLYGTTNLIIQRAVARRNLQDNYEGFFDFSTILFNFVENKQIPIVDENLVLNGIDYIIPFTDNTCIMKTGFSLLEDDRHDLLSKEEASVESLIMINVQQFISDPHA